MDSKPKSTTVLPDKPLDFYTTNISSSPPQSYTNNQPKHIKNHGEIQVRKTIHTHDFISNSGQSTITHTKTPSQAISTLQDEQIHDLIPSQNNLNQNLTHTSSKAATTNFPPQFSTPTSTITVAHHHHYPLLIMANKTHIWVLTNLSQIGRNW
ncbi:Hypothetical predicted protein, partial [Olea europaea subsp. europaea]